jgi:photosystem II stability/assembly factor-like uncharacterized protein
MIGMLLLGGGAERLAGQTTAPSSRFSLAVQELQFRLLGPSRGGRVTAVTGIADQPLTFYFGSTGGGVWKTVNAGQTWENLSDGFFASPSIGSIDVADSDPNVVFVGTGSDAIRSNVITGKGVYRSRDGGKTWSAVGLERVGQIGAVVIHPTDPNVVYVAAIGQAFAPNAERGVYRTRDGGATWTRVLFVSDSTGAADLELAPDNPREIYATMWTGRRLPWTIVSGSREGGIYRSRDGGDTWTKLAGGLPSGLVGKADLAVSAAGPNRVYALIEAPPGEGGVYRSDDRGVTWTRKSTQASLLDRPFYYTNIDADPSNADRVFVSSTGFFASIDGGATWQRRSVPHGDNHDLWINPKHPDIWIQSNDGGATVTLDGGKSWSTELNQPTAELYQIAVDDQYPYWVYAGQQDNSTIAVPSLPPLAWFPDQPAAWWRQVGGCETGPAVPRPGGAAIVYSNCKGQFGRYSARTGQEQAYWVGARDLYGHDPKEMRDRFQRVSQIVVSPHDPNLVYHASQYLYRTKDGGKTWVRISPDLTANEPDKQVISGTPITRDVTGEEYYSTIYSVRESPLERGALLVGANDGPVHLSRDGGAHWARVTPPDLPPGGRVQNVEWSPHRKGKAYLAVYRYLLGDWRPYLYRTRDYGASWTRLTTGTNGIPADYPTRVVREDPNREGLLYAGTEFGLFVSFDDGDRWEPLQQNLPITPVTDLAVHRKDLVLSTMGRSFWMLDDLSPIEQSNPAAEPRAPVLFHPRDAIRYRYALSGIGGGRAPGEAEYPPPGMDFDYLLPVAATSPVRLEIRDANGRPVRVLSSDSAGPPPRLSTAAGHHRIHWDYELLGPWDPVAERSGLGGPWAVPGPYEARLTAGGATVSTRFSIRPDPRVVADGVTARDLEQQLATALAARDLVSDVRRLVAAVAERRKRGDNERLAALARTLTADSGRYPTPRLQEEAEYLYRMTGLADQRLGRDVTLRVAELLGLAARAKATLAAITP